VGGNQPGRILVVEMRGHEGGGSAITFLRRPSAKTKTGEVGNHPSLRFPNCPRPAPLLLKQPASGCRRPSSRA
jgi:hypothetical protein